MFHVLRLNTFLFYIFKEKLFAKQQSKIFCNADIFRKDLDNVTVSDVG